MFCWNMPCLFCNSIHLTVFQLKIDIAILVIWRSPRLFYRHATKIVIVSLVVLILSQLKIVIWYHNALSQYRTSLLICWWRRSLCWYIPGNLYPWVDIGIVRKVWVFERCRGQENTTPGPWYSVVYMKNLTQDRKNEKTCLAMTYSKADVQFYFLKFSVNNIP